MKTKPKYHLMSFKKQIKIGGMAITFLVLIASNCFGQSITWQRTYDGPANQNDRVFSLSPADGNNFYAVGSTVISGNYHYILKLNEFGDTLWSRSIQLDPPYGSYCMSSTEDGYGGIVVTGQNDTSFTMRLDKYGNIIWYKNYNMIAATGNRIIKKNNNGYLICGRKLSADYYGYVLNVDSSGNMIWQKLFPSTEFKNYESVVELNNGFYLSGDVMDAIIDTQHVLLTKINYSGDIEWEKRYTVLGRGGNAKKIVKLPGRLLIAGTTTDSLPSGKGYFIITDTNGSETTTKIFHYPKNERLSDVIAINSNKLLFTLIRDSTNILSITRILITDTTGNILHERFFVPPQRDGYIFFESMIKANNGDFIFGGYSQLDTNINTEDVHLARTDSLLYAPPIAIINSNSQIPKTFEISEPYPNPFNPVTNIRYEIPKDVNVSIMIYDILGKEVFSYNEYKKAGSYEVQFDGTNLASGMYFYKLEANGFVDTKKMVLLK